MSQIRNVVGIAVTATQSDGPPDEAGFGVTCGEAPERRLFVTSGRVVLLGLLRVDNAWYLGHPNGPVNWTRNLDAAGTVSLMLVHEPPIEIRSELLPDGEERRRASWKGPLIGDEERDFLPTGRGRPASD